MMYRAPFRGYIFVENENACAHALGEKTSGKSAFHDWLLLDSSEISGIGSHLKITCKGLPL